MRYMIRETFFCQRGHAPEIVADFKIINDMMMRAGCTNGKIYVDITGRMDTVIYEFETDSLDKYFSMERAIYINPDVDTTKLINHLNENAAQGSREIYEVIL
jgi:hypothetical protein